MAKGVVDLRVKVAIDGEPLELQFHSVEIRQRLFEPTVVRLEIGYTNDRERGTLTDTIGKMLVVQIQDELSKETSQKHSGKITGYTLTDDNIILNARSVDFLLTAGRQHRTFEDMKISDVVNKIVDENKMRCEVGDTATQFSFLQQYGETDYEFISRLASYCGFAFYYDGEKFQFRKDFSNAEKIKVAGEDLDGITMHCDIGDVLKKVGSFYDHEKHNDPGGGKETSSLGKPEIPGLKDVFPPAKEDQDFNIQVAERSAIKDYVQAAEARAAAEFQRVKGSTGNPMVVVGKTIDSDDSILKAEHVVIGLDAEFKGNVYTGAFEAMPGAIPISPEPPHLKHSVMLQPAIVTNNKDDKEMGRVKVKYAWAADDETHWARTMSAGAGGDNHGTYFIPRVGDEVLIGFENGDVSHPVVLGALYHSEDKPKFITENGTEEVLLVKTPNSAIRVVDKDQDEYISITMKDTKNVIKLELKGPQITIESQDGTITVKSKKIELKADDSLAMSGRNIEMKAQENIKIEAQKNIECKAQMDIKLSGGTNASLEGTAKASVKGTQVESTATATQTIKGALVQIN